MTATTGSRSSNHSDVRVIALDGPSASGKSTLARSLARYLGWNHVDTGSMYRWLAWWCLKRELNPHSRRTAAGILRFWKTRWLVENGQLCFVVEGADPAADLRTPEVSQAASIISAHPGVRRWMVRHQREATAFGPCVMEGRDIGTNVFPEAELKLFVDASAEARAARRGDNRESLAARDQRDSQRRGNPLAQALGAHRIDNSGETPEQTLTRTIALLLHLKPEWIPSPAKPESR